MLSSVDILSHQSNLRQIPHIPSDTFSLVAELAITEANLYASIWEHIRHKRYQEGLRLLSVIKSQDNKWLLTSARCLQGLKYYQKALANYLKINMALLTKLDICYKSKFWNK